MDFQDLFNRYRFQAYAGIIIVVVVIVLSVVLINNRAQAKDVILMNQLKEFSSGLENYFSQHQAYPLATEVDINKNVVLSDNGFADPQGTIYYKGAINAGAVSFTTDATSYNISFKLRRQWPVVGATEGKYCIIKPNFKISCGKEGA